MAERGFNRIRKAGEDKEAPKKVETIYYPVRHKLKIEKCNLN